MNTEKTLQQQAKLKLHQLFTFKSSQWMLAWGVGLLALFATIGLLSISGWFISAAAIAGLITSGGAISFDFFRPAAVIRTFAIARTAGRYGERLASHRAVLNLLTDLRCLFFTAISQQKLGPATPNATDYWVQSSDAMQRLTHDIDQLDELPLRFWAPWFWAFVLQCVLLGFIACFSPSLVGGIAVPLIIAGCVIPFVGVILGKNMAHTYTHLAEVRRRYLLNPLTACTSLILWGKWPDFQNQFYKSDTDYNQLHLRQRSVGILLNGLQQIALAFVIVLLIQQGYPLLVSGALSVPLLLAYVLAVLGLYEVLLPLASNYTAYGFALASRDRLNALLVKEHAKSHPKLPFPDQTIKLTAEQVCAKFPSALSGVERASFSLQTGDVLFVKGQSGAGKSTLLHALALELPLISGAIKLNNQPLERIALGEQLGYLAQQLDLFDLTLAQNLRVGHAEATDEELWQVLEKVNLSKWAKQQPLGLNTPLGEYASTVSGGQARRIALARLLLKPRKILLLDEPFAGLDAESVKHVYASLKHHQKSGVLIIVSHYFVPDDAKIIHV